MRPRDAATRGLGMRGRLLLVVLPTIALALAVSGGLSVLTARDGLHEMSDRNQRLNAQSLAHAVERTLKEAHSDAVTTARLDLAAEAIESGDPKNFTWYADQLVQTKDRYVALVVADEAGKVIGANDRARDGSLIQPPLTEWSIADQPWHRAAFTAEGDRAVVSDPVRLPELTRLPGGAEGVVAMSRPIFDVLDERVGTLTVFCSLAAIGDRLAGFHVRHEHLESTALIIDGTGRAVVAPPGLDPAAWRLDGAGLEHGATWKSPEGDVFRVSSLPITGPLTEQAWQLVTLSALQVIEAPVSAITDRLWLVFLLAIALSSGVLVAVASRFVGPIVRLSRAASSAERASDLKPVEIERHDEVGHLASSFNRMVATIQSYERHLEDKVAERTAQLASAKREVTDILDNIEDAIFTVAPTGLVNSEFSASCRKVYGDVPIAGAKAVELLQLATATSNESASRTAFWLASIFGGDELQWVLVESEPVRELLYHRRGDEKPSTILELEYAPIYEAGKIAKVMVVARDVTQLRSLADEVRKKEEQNRTNLARVAEIVALDPELFRTFVAEADELFAEAEGAVAKMRADATDREALNALFRAIHTLKGNARIFKLSTIQNAAHELEDGLAKLRDDKAPPSREAIDHLGEGLANLQRLRSEFTELANRVLGLGSGEGKSGAGVAVPEAKIMNLRRVYKELNRALGKGESAEAQVLTVQLEDAIRTLTQVPVGEVMERFRKMTFDLAKELGRQLDDLVVIGGDIAVDLKLVQLMRDALMHALRNAVDHGIEEPEARLAAGKPPKGTIRIECGIDGGALVLGVSDDGRGIDLARVRNKAFAQGFISEDRLDTVADEDLIEVLFQPGFSTAERVTAVSGRGVGMDVIRATMRKLRGDARVRTKPGKGTTIELRLPADYYQQL